MVKIKICGVTNEADAEEASRLGADAIGLNFYPKSPRCIGKEMAQSILQVLPPFVEAVGVFVEPNLAVAEEMKLRTLQIHRAGARWDIFLRGSWYHRYILAFPVRDRESLTLIQDYLREAAAQAATPAAILIDAHVPGLHGGTGRTAPWEILADFQPGVPVILAGGLTPENVAQAIRRVRPYAVDVASGVESSPGKKDRDKMRKFIDEARCAKVKNEPEA